jgi:hypothetical protein
MVPVAVRVSTTVSHLALTGVAHLQPGERVLFWS